MVNVTPLSKPMHARAEREGFTADRREIELTVLPKQRNKERRDWQDVESETGSDEGVRWRAVFCTNLSVSVVWDGTSTVVSRIPHLCSLVPGTAIIIRTGRQMASCWRNMASYACHPLPLHRLASHTTKV